VSDERVTAFLNWLTEGGRVRFGYDSRNGAPEALWLGVVEVRRSDLARVVKGWPGGVGLSPESADALAGMAVARVAATDGRVWSISAQ
jgi:hypothetical protein